jgi:antitoxin PrlF
MRAIVSSKGQVTIPRELRELAHIEKGTQLDFQLTANGCLLVRPLPNDVANLKGIAKRKNQPVVSLADMKKAITEGFEEGML